MNQDNMNKKSLGRDSVQSSYRKALLRRMNYFFITLGGVFLSGCAANIDVAENAREQYQQAIEESEKTAPQVPEAVLDSLLNANSNTAPQKEEAIRFDVSVNQIPAQSFFVSLVSQADVNVVAHPEIEGFISLDLTDVTVAEVLSVVRDVYGYEYKYQSGIYTIYPRKLRTQLFHIDYPDFQRVGVTDTSVSIGNINSSSNDNNNNSSNNNNNSNNAGGNAGLGGADSGDGEGSGRNGRGAGFSPGARLQTVNATDFWQLLQTSIEGIIGGDEDGRFVVTNPLAGIVVIKALPTEISAVREFLDKSELSVRRQVILETKILEVRLSERFESGINWGAISGALSLQNNISGFGDVADILIDGEGASEVLYTSTLRVNDITNLIGLLDTQGDVSVLSSPRISTVNNQKAVIRVGSDEFFVTGISNSTTTSAAATTSAPEVELTSFFSGISLDVTPQIAEDGDVILHVHPIVSEVQDQLKQIQVGEDNFSLPLALRDIRESDSIVRASSGQVVVLGGLMQETSQDVDTRRSWLGDVPVLNILFRRQEQVKQKTELVILMRPVVIDDDWQGELVRGQQRFDQLGQ